MKHIVECRDCAFWDKGGSSEEDEGFCCVKSPTVFVMESGFISVFPMTRALMGCAEGYDEKESALWPKVRAGMN